MESQKMKQEELVKKIEEMREQRKVKEKARLDKLRTINMQKYNTEGKSSVFQNSKLKTTQSRPKNFNSMTDLRRKSMIPKSAPKSAPVDKTSQLPKLSDATINAKERNGVLDAAIVPNTHESSDLTTNQPLHTSNIPTLCVTEPTSSKYTNGTITAKDTKDESDGKVPSIIAAGGVPKPNKKLSMLETKADKPKQVRKSIAVSNQRKSMAAGSSKLAPIKKDVPETVSNPGQSKITMKKPLPNIPTVSSVNPKKMMNGNKSLITKDSAASSKNSLSVKTDSRTPSKISVFERLYKPKNQTEKPPASHRRETIFEQKNKPVATFASSRRSMAPQVIVKKDQTVKMRRSISAVHFKRIGKGELKNCHHRYSSFKEGLDKVDITKINEDEPVANLQAVSMIRSEKKKTVKFQTATPRADELERKLKSWLQNRGKSVDAFHHLRCFGIDRLAPSEKDIFNVEPYDEENKENIEIEDDQSVSELMNDRVNDFEEMKMKWRRASCFNDSEVYSECTEAGDKSLVSTETPVIPVDQLLLGALSDLTQLVRDGYDWEQCARWLRAIRSRSPHATELAAYWECRAALEEGRGNLPRSCLCWEEAIAKGTETSVVEASLDQLLDKFMQLNISPERAQRPLDAREMLCAKNVFKSSLIRFAVQNARVKSEMAKKYTVTPVRRSSRISCVGSAGAGATPRPRADARTPLLQLASSLQHIDEDIRSNSMFVPNKLLQYSP